MTTAPAHKVEAPDPVYLAAVLRQRQAMAAQLDRAKAMFAVIDTDATALLAQQYTATKSTKSEVTLPDGSTTFATVTRIPGVAEAEITDREAFHAWVRDTYPEHWSYQVIPARTETVVDGAFADRVLAAVNAARVTEYADPDTGVVHEVPGIAIRPKRRPYFKWLFSRTSKSQPLDGRDLIGDAIRGGQLDIDAPPTPPALAPAAEPADQ